MMSSQETTRMVELLTTAAKLPDKMQALALGYAKGLADAEKLHKQSQPAQGNFVLPCHQLQGCSKIKEICF